MTVPIAFALGERLDPGTAAGLAALALAPGALLAPALLTAAGGRHADMAGALSLGTVILSFVLVVTRPGATTLALAAAQAFVFASLAAGAVPTIRDRILLPLRRVGHLAALAVLVLVVAARPPIDASTVMLALGALALTLAVAGAVAVALRRDVPSGLAAVGTRDPVVATVLAWSTGGPDAAAVPLVNAAILGIAAAAILIRRR
ncbi:MAG: hypothetical protein WEE03_04235 [Chloroflexota bacterium]